MIPPFQILAATPEHLEGLYELASYHNSLNLPLNRERLRSALSHSEKSFAGVVSNPADRVFRFVLLRSADNRVVGTSMVAAQLGKIGLPYIYFDVRTEERFSASVSRHFRHQLLDIRYVYNGPTELGSLVVHPEFRGHAQKLGKQISLIRFLFIAMNRQLFQDEIVAELMPPFEEDGSSALWEAVGRKFTGMGYHEADRLSKENKEFIRGLFPRGEIYASLLPSNVQNVIGKVGPASIGAARMLENLGFQYAKRVDPFDGGPHYTAKTDRIPYLKQATPHLHSPLKNQTSLIASAYKTPPYFAGLLSTPDDSISFETFQEISAAEATLQFSIPFSL